MARKMRFDVAFITRWPLLILIVALLSLVQSVSAQTAGTGALTGTVVDPSGGAVGGAKIVVTSRATGETRTVLTDARGIFLAPALLPELYRIEVSKDGFKTLTATDIKITVTE